MKKCLLSMLAVAFMATAANAAVIGLRWSDTAAQKHDGPGTVEMYLDLVTGDVVAAANADAVCISGDCSNLVLSGWTPVAPNWTVGGIDGGIGSPDFAGTQNGANSAADALTGPASVVIGTFDVAITGAFDGTEKGFGLSWHNNPGGGVIDTAAASLTWDGRYGAFSGYVAYGDYGSPGWNNAKGNFAGAQPENPLIITKIPEPTSMALVALGGFALLRRRR